MRIRSATESDIPDILALGDLFWKQTVYYKEHKIPLDPETGEEVIRCCMLEGAALLLEDDGLLLGMILVPVTHCMMNKNYKFAAEYGFYVDPALRNKGAGQKLIEAATQVLRDKGIALFTMVSMKYVTPAAANHLYESMGFEHTETGFTKDIR